MADQETSADSKALARQGDVDPDNVGSKLLEFLSKYLAEAGTRMAMRIELRCVSDQYRTEPLETWSRESEPELFGKLTHTEAIVAKIVGLMEDHTDAAAEASMFEVVVRHYDHAVHQRRLRVMPRRRQGDDRGMLLPNETPTGTGLLAMLMRHNETMLRMVETKDKSTAALQRGSVDSILQLLKETREENKALRDERAQHLREIEDARSQEAERDMAAASQDAADKRRAVLTDKFAMVLPVLAQAIAGRLQKGKADAKPGPHTRTPLEDVLLKFMTTMTDAQIAAVKGVLDIEQGLVLGGAIDAAEQGGSALLSTMVNDFVKSLRQPQLAALMEHLTPDQRKLLIEAMKLARATAPGPDLANANSLGTERAQGT